MDLWAIGTHDLGLTDEQFGRQTQLSFDALLERKKIKDRNEWLRTGEVASMLFNCHRGEKQKSLTALDFVPGYLRNEQSKDFDLRNLSPQEQAEHVLGVFRSIGQPPPGVIRKLRKDI